MLFTWINRVIQKVRARPLLFFIFLHALLLAVFSILDYLWSTAGYGTNGAAAEWYIAAQILDGNVPYRDFVCEYPPLALLSFLLPGLISSSLPAYFFLFAVEMFLLDLVVLFIIWKLAARFKLGLWRVLGFYTLSLLAVGVIVTGRYDLFPATLVLVALYAFVIGKNKTAWAFLGLGAMAKVYPVVIAPFFALYLLRHREYKKLIYGVAIFGGIVLALILPWIIISPEGFWQLISYHAQRGLHAESSYASVLLIGQILGLTQVTASLSYGSWNLISPLADSLSQVSFYITAILLLITYALYTRLLWRKSDAIAAISNDWAAGLMLRYSAIAILIMLLASKVFSAQYLVWLAPILPLLRGRWRYVPWLLFLVVGGLTQYIYPFHYEEFELFTLGPGFGAPYPAVILAVRNFLLVVMAVFLFLPARSQMANKELPTPSERT